MHPSSTFTSIAPVLIGILRQIWNGEIVSEERFPLNPTAGEITIGRSAKYSIGKAFLEQDPVVGRTVAGSISRIQATIRFEEENGEIVPILYDGIPGGGRTPNRIKTGNQWVERMVLTAAREVFLFNVTPGVVSLVVREDSEVRDKGHDTYNPDQVQDAIWQQSKHNGDRLVVVEERLERVEELLEQKQMSDDTLKSDVQAVKQDVSVMKQDVATVKTELSSQSEINSVQSALIKEQSAAIEQYRSLFTQIKQYIPAAITAVALVVLCNWFINLEKNKQEGVEKFFGLMGGGGMLAIAGWIGGKGKDEKKAKES